MNAYHNLAGWLRDVRNVLGDRTALADSYYWQLRDLLEEALELVGDDVPDSEELESEDGDDDMGDVGPRDSGDVGAQRSRPGAKRENQVGGSPGMGDTLPRESGKRKGNTAGDPAAVARAGCGVSRQTTVTVTSDGFVPSGNRATPRPNVKRTRRGTKGSTKRGTRKKK